MLAAILLAAVALLASAKADSSTTTDLLWPLPRSVKFSSTVYSLDPASFIIQGSGAGGESSIIKDAFTRYQYLIFETKPPFFPSGTSSGPTTFLVSLTVDVGSADETLTPDTAENYILNVTSDAKAMISAPNVFAALRGLETFSQLVYRSMDGGFLITQVDIADTPRFGFRGTMIDTSRHFLSLRTILDHLDAMSYNKFNVLHWHIVDDQSFPYDSATFPELSLKGAYDMHHIYSEENMQRVIQTALYRGIRVIPEFDTPGHTQSWGKGEPDLLTPCYASGKPTGKYGPINPILNTTWTFLKALFSEVQHVFPDPYIHLGGDEVSFSCWESNPDIQQWMKEHGYTNYAKLEQYYETNLLQLIKDLGSDYIVWQEIFDNGLTVLPNTVIEVWKGGNNWGPEMAAVTKSGLKAVLSACWYLNYISYGTDWEKYYKCDPQNFNGTEAQLALVFGGEACMWAEYVDSTDFLQRFWPRGSAVGERLWSDKSVTDIGDASGRLHNMRCRMISRGISAEPAQGPSFCATEWGEEP